MLPCGSRKNHTTALRAGECHRRWLITVMLIMPYDIESQSRNADFMFIARKGDTTTLGLKGRQT